LLGGGITLSGELLAAKLPSLLPPLNPAEHPLGPLVSEALPADAPEAGALGSYPVC